MVNVEVVPLKGTKEHCFLILFDDAENGSRATFGTTSREHPGGATRTRRPAGKKEEARYIAAMERDLSETRDYLQAIQEQHEATTEELQASNEEIQSANEELQSVNEELETSKEELESANEELNTVNEEMATRNIELNRLNSDLFNLQTSTRLAIVLFGRDLTIRRFSPQAEKQLNLMATDVGRPIGEVRHNLDLTDLEPFIAEVIASVREREREVRDKEGRWFSLRVRPYLSLDNKVDGAVLVLVDIDALKRTELLVSESREYAEAIIRTVPDPLVILRADLRVQSANEAFYRAFRLSPAEAEGRSIFELSHGSWTIPGLSKLLEDIVLRNSSFDDFEVTHEFERIGHRALLLNARTLLQAEGKNKLVLLGIRDITGRMHAEEAARNSLARFQILADNIAQLAWTCDRLGDVTWYNKRWLDYTGLTFEDMKEWGWRRVQHPDHVDRVVAGVKHSQDTGEIWEDTFPLRGKDGNYRWFLSRAVPVRDAAGNLIRWFGTNTDITNERKAEERQRFLMNELAHRGKNLLTVI